MLTGMDRPELLEEMHSECVKIETEKMCLDWEYDFAVKGIKTRKIFVLVSIILCISQIVAYSFGQELNIFIVIGAALNTSIFWYSVNDIIMLKSKRRMCIPKMADINHRIRSLMINKVIIKESNFADINGDLANHVIKRINNLEQYNIDDILGE